MAPPPSVPRANRRVLANVFGALVVLASMLATSTASAQSGDAERIPPPSTSDSGLEVSSFSVALPGSDAPPSPDGRLAFAVRDDTTVIDVGPAALGLDSGPEMLIIDAGRETAELSVRSRSNGVWSEWIDVETETEDAPDGLAGEEGSRRSTNAVGPIWLGTDADQVEIVHRGGSASSLVVEALNSTDDAAETDDDDRRGLSTVAGRPAMRFRSAWATGGWAYGNEDCEDGPDLAENIQAAVVHHTVTANTYAQSQVDDLLRGIYRYHTVTQGWCDIAYNFVVDRFGTIWEARTGSASDPVIGGHTKGFNTSTVGIALLGQHQSGASPTASTPTTGSMASVQAVAAWKLSLHGVDPLGSTWLQYRSTRAPHKFTPQSWVPVPAVVSHRDLGVTSCPGSLAVPSIVPMRAALAPAHRTGPPHLPPARNRAEFGPATITLDQNGGLRAGGSAIDLTSAATPSGVTAVAMSGRFNQGQILLSDGTLRPMASAPRVDGRPAGNTPAVDVSMAADHRGGWVLADDGRIFDFGTASDRTAPAKPASGDALRLGLNEQGRGYIVDVRGGLFAVHGAPDRSIGTSVTAIDVALRGEGTTGWVLDSSGRLHAFGGAPKWQPESPVANPRALLTGGSNGGWVMDSEGRFTRFGLERRMTPANTTTGHATAVDAAIVGWDLTDAADDMKYAAALRRLFLGREGDRRDVDLLAHRAVEFGSAQVVTGLAQSDEWAGALLEDMYRDVLGRSPDPQGRAFWISQLENGLKTQEMGALFYASAEYVEDAGSTDAWLRRLYRALLDRPADDAGLAYWKDLLDRGRESPISVTLKFYQSAESREGRVTGLYREILGRAPEGDGLQFWAAQLFTIDDIRLAVELATSEEYYDRVTA